jgi:hypothetical protein
MRVRDITENDTFIADVRESFSDKFALAKLVRVYNDAFRNAPRRASDFVRDAVDELMRKLVQLRLIEDLIESENR